MEKLRKFIFRTSLAASLAVTMLWLCAQFFTFSYYRAPPPKPAAAPMFSHIANGPQTLWFGNSWTYYSTGATVEWRPAYHWQFADFRNVLLPSLQLPTPSYPGHYGVGVPFWLLLSLAASPAAALWFSRPRPANPLACPHCRYNLTGNTTGACPECGKATADNQPSSR